MLKPYRRAEVGFDVIREIGQQGRNSRAFVVNDHQLDAELVAKEIAKAQINPADYFNEAKVIYATSHPNVVQICYACEDVNSIYLVMPYYQAGSLKSLITNNILTVREIISLGIQISAGLHNIHSKGFIHFDLKPDNILLSARGEALVSDFGLAKPMIVGQQAQQDMFYMKILPPEGFQVGNQFGKTFDIYQFGLLLYRMCNGDEEFYRQFDQFRPGGIFNRQVFEAAVLAGEFPRRQQGDFLPHIPVKLRRLIQSCMEVDAAQRPQSALEVANGLADVDGPLLDWKCELQNAARVWTRNKNGTIWTLTVDANGTSSCVKVPPSGRSQRVGNGCRARITDAQIRAFLDAD